MSDPHYEPIPPLSRDEVEAALARDEPDELLRVVLAAALYADDGAWAEDVCLRLAAHPHPDVRGNAVLGLGHIARIHGRLEAARALPAIEAALADADDFVRGQADAAAGDVEHFLGWRTSRPDPLRDWMEGALTNGVRFGPGAAVRIDSGQNSGAVGAVVTVLDFEPEPLYLVELDGGEDVRVLQSALQPT